MCCYMVGPFKISNNILLAFVCFLKTSNRSFFLFLFSYSVYFISFFFIISIIIISYYANFKVRVCCLQPPLTLRSLGIQFFLNKFYFFYVFVSFITNIHSMCMWQKKMKKKIKMKVSQRTIFVYPIWNTPDSLEGRKEHVYDAVTTFFFQENKQSNEQEQKAQSLLVAWFQLGFIFYVTKNKDYLLKCLNIVH